MEPSKIREKLRSLGKGDKVSVRLETISFDNLVLKEREYNNRDVRYVLYNNEGNSEVYIKVDDSQKILHGGDPIIECMGDGFRQRVKKLEMH